MEKSNLLLYREKENNSVISNMLALGLETMETEQDINDMSIDCIHKILETAVQMGFRGNLWQNYITLFLVSNENGFSITCERKGLLEGSINKAALHDITILKKIFDLDLSEFDQKNNTMLSCLLDFINNNEEDKYFNKRIRDGILELSIALNTAENEEAFLEILCEYYKTVGVGKFGMFKAFRVVHNESDSSTIIDPIISIEHKYLDDLIGYEIQKNKLRENTEAFLEGKKANNVLLFGDSGTGKSSCIKAILNEYNTQGLRMIEVYKHQFKDLSFIINQIKDRNYKFIIYMDDLSFEEFEIEYKYLKAIIEGGLEKKPDNVLIYATSNRRHLVREKFTDKEERDDDLHSRDTVQEKLSLSARFGLPIYFGSPDKKEFTQIVLGLYKKNSLNLDEHIILREANKWEIAHGGLSGRTAQQFVNYLEYSYK